LLVFAAGAACPRLVRELLAKHSADINAVYLYTKEKGEASFEQSPLMAASRVGDTNIVRLLLNTEGIQPDLSADFGTTALILAAKEGFVAVVKMLVADPRVKADHKDENGRTALSHAAECAQEAVVAELLATSAVNPDNHDNKARTPLMWAVNHEYGYGLTGWQSYEGVVRRLLASDQVNPTSRDTFSYTPLSSAACGGGLGLVMALLEHPQTDAESGYQNTPLARAASAGHVEVVQMLLNTGQVDVNAVSTGKYYGGTALALAASFGCENVVRLLLSVPGIDPNRKGRGGDPPLTAAARQGKVEIVRHLLAAADIDPNIQDWKGRTALSTAAGAFFSRQAAAVMRELVKAPGINADLADDTGRTALSLAAEAADAERVAILLAADGVNPDARDKAGRSPLSWVFTYDRFNDRGTDGRTEVVRLLLRMPAVDPNAEDAEGRTPLLQAIRFDRSSEFVELLLARADLDVNRPGRDGRSPMAVAKGIGNTVTIALLGARGATAPDEEPAVLGGETVSSDGSVSDESSGSGVDDLVDEQSAVGRPQQQQQYELSSHGSSSNLTTDFDLNRPRGLSQSLKKLLRQELGREYRLPLGAQDEYISEWAAESTASLCPVCTAIDLDAAFSSRHTEHKGRVIADLGRVDCRQRPARRPHRPPWDQLPR
jgi:ankyrin repeat protein